MTNLLQEPSHDGSAQYITHPSPALGDEVALFLRAPDAAQVRRVYVRTTPDAEPRFTEARIDRGTGGETWWRVDVRAHNPVTRYRFLLDTGHGSRWLTARGLADHDVPDATDFRLVADDPPPAWTADAVVYQIFPDRFARSPRSATRALPDWAIGCDWDTPVVGRGPQTPYQIYGGDLDGIVSKLDHIERLGATAVYLTPVFPARSNHRYDAAAFDRVDPLLGGDEALVRLADAVHARGMRLIGDLTTNHCGDAHPWFLAASADSGSTEREMFYFDGDDYVSWNGVRSLPKLNWGSAQTRRRMREVAQHWLRSPYNVDGWRVDVANMTGRLGADDHAHEVARLLREAVRSVAGDRLLVAEHGHDATGDLDRRGWDGTMNYAGFTRPVWSWLRSPDLALPDFIGVPGGVPQRGGAEAVATMRAFASLQSWRSLTHSWTMLGSHDTARIATVIDDQARLEVAFGLLATMPGVPMVFAGDEVGLLGVNGEDSRRPMPWDGGGNATTFATLRSLIGLRRRLAALRHGGLRWVHASDDAIAYLRETSTQRLLVLARRAQGKPLTLEVTAGPDGPLANVADVANVYGGATALLGPDGRLVLPGDGPTFQIWQL